MRNERDMSVAKLMWAIVDHSISVWYPTESDISLSKRTRLDWLIWHAHLYIQKFCQSTMDVIKFIWACGKGWMKAMAISLFTRCKQPVTTWRMMGLPGTITRWPQAGMKGTGSTNLYAIVPGLVFTVAPKGVFSTQATWIVEHGRWMPRTRFAYSLKEEKTINDDDEDVDGTVGGGVVLGSSSMNSGALSLRGRRQGTVTGEGIECIPVSSVIYSVTEW